MVAHCMYCILVRTVHFSWFLLDITHLQSSLVVRKSGREPATVSHEWYKDRIVAWVHWGLEQQEEREYLPHVSIEWRRRRLSYTQNIECVVG